MSNSGSTNLQHKDQEILVERAVRKTLELFSSRKLSADQLAFTMVDLRNPHQPVRSHYRGDTPIYPASVIKLFYLAATHRQLEDGRLQDTPELRRALHDMIVHSYNEATSYVVDLLTGTTSGPELPEDELREWFDKRNAVNRYFTSLGYTNINVNKKPWGEGPYGRETQAIQAFTPTRNSLTTNATARLLREIVTGKAVSPARSDQMMALLKRDFGADPNSQARDFTGRALPPSAKLWSKAGWMSTARHDAAYVELAGGARFVLITFTEGHSDETEIIPALVRAALEDFLN